jgi:DNA-binding winged helix-turn-helix (wHTH) protein/tetratricopeptide (TPR) repeat protein
MGPMLTRPVLKFGSYTVDTSLGELRKDGVRIPIQEKPLRLLAALAERQGELVTRAELHQHLWKGEAFVDFDNGLNTAVRKLRTALGDESESPRYIETIPRRGYRFLALVEVVNGVTAAQARQSESVVSLTADLESAAAAAATRGIASKPEFRESPARRSLGSLVLLSAAVLISVGGAVAWFAYSRPVFSFNSRDSVLISDFENQTGDPRFDQALETAFTVSMGQSRHANVFPRARLASVLALMGKAPGERITLALGREICQRENIRGLISLGITRTGEEYALSAELLDPQSGETVRSYTQRSYGEGHILDALDVIAADIRRDLGESLYQIHENTQPLPEVTTASLAALKEYADGTSLWHQGRYQDAVTLYRAAIQADPNFAMAHASLGNAYYSFIYNDSQKGNEEYLKALALASRTTERERMNIQVNYADSQGHFEEAERLYQIYLKRYPDDWVMLSSYARLLRTNGYADEAISQYKEMLRVAPNDARAQVELATAYKTLGRFQEAVGAYTQAFQIDPLYLTAGDVSREYGMALILNGEIQKAEGVFTSLLGNQKTRESGLRSLALLDLYRGKYASARPLLEEALAYDEGLKSEPVSVARVHLLLAILAEGEGDTRTERRQLDSAMANFKTLPPKVILGAWIGSEYVRAELPRQAEQIESIIAPIVDGKNPEQVAYAHFLQGEIALQQGNNDKALQLFSLSDRGKSTPYSMDGLARAYQQSGKITQAVSQYEKFLASPSHGLLWEPQQRWLAAHYTLAADYLALGNPAKAREALNPLLLLWKDADQTLPLRIQAIALSERLK